MNAMQKLAEIENERARRNWDRSRRKIPKEVGKIFLKVKVPVPIKRQRMAMIIEAVCEETGVAHEDLLSRSRQADIALARQYAMWKCREQGYSFPQIGHVFDRDHTTIIHGCRVIDRAMEAGQ